MSPPFSAFPVPAAPNALSAFWPRLGPGLLFYSVLQPMSGEHVSCCHPLAQHPLPRSRSLPGCRAHTGLLNLRRCIPVLGLVQDKHRINICSISSRPCFLHQSPVPKASVWDPPLTSDLMPLTPPPCSPGAGLHLVSSRLWTDRLINFSFVKRCEPIISGLSVLSSHQDISPLGLRLWSSGPPAPPILPPPPAAPGAWFGHAPRTQEQVPKGGGECLAQLVCALQGECCRARWSLIGWKTAHQRAWPCALGGI